MQIFFSTNHLWLHSLDQKLWTLGLSEQAAEKMGMSVYVQFVERKSLNKGELFAVIESTKAAIDIETFTQLEKVEYNQSLLSHPEWVYEDSQGKGWLLKGQLCHLEELNALMSQEQYLQFIKSQP